MKVGLTYDLRDDYLAQGFTIEQAAEFDSRETIESLEAALAENGYKVERIGNIKSLVRMLSDGRRWDIVFNICEGVSGIAREAQVPALLEAYDIPCVFSGADVMVTTMDKSLAKIIVRENGLPTAPYKVIRSSDDFKGLDLTYPLFAKPLAEGTGKGIDARSEISSAEELQNKCFKLLDDFNQPVLVEEFLPGRDLTVGIIGNGPDCRVIGVLEALYKNNAEGQSQSFFNKENCETVLEYVLVKDAVATKAGEIALACWQALGCLDGGRVDLRCDRNGTPCFLEVNPLSGLHPTHSDLPILAAQAGITYRQLIGEIMNAALSRLFKVRQNNENYRAAV